MGSVSLNDVADVMVAPVWVPASLVFAFFEAKARLNPSLATINPSSRPKFIPLSTPSSYLSSIFFSKFLKTDFLPFS
jgi:hypothetical protein